MNVTSILSVIDAEIARLQQARAALADLGGSTKRGPGRPPKAAAPTRKKRVLSAEARARIAAAQKKRWAAAKKSSS